MEGNSRLICTSSDATIREINVVILHVAASAPSGSRGYENERELTGDNCYLSARISAPSLSCDGSVYPKRNGPSECDEEYNKRSDASDFHPLLVAEN